MVLLFYLCDIFYKQCQCLFQDKIAKFGISDFFKIKKKTELAVLLHTCKYNIIIYV